MKKTMRQSVTVSALLKTKTYKSSAPLHDRRPGPHIQTSKTFIQLAFVVCSQPFGASHPADCALTSSKVALDSCVCVVLPVAIDFTEHFARIGKAHSSFVFSILLVHLGTARTSTICHLTKNSQAIDWDKIKALLFRMKLVTGLSVATTLFTLIQRIQQGVHKAVSHTTFLQPPATFCCIEKPCFVLREKPNEFPRSTCIDCVQWNLQILP
eukprot:c25444_g1_i3 orf=98-730(+)